MKYVFLIYAALIGVALTLHSTPPKKAPECGPGVLCIREQKTVKAALPETSQRYTEQFISQAKSQ
jgi:hypothetical protein